MVKEFNNSFNMVSHDTPQRNIFTEDKKTVDLRWKLIDEECKELKEAIDTHDFGEVRDALSDIMYVVLGAADAFGINIESDFTEVHLSNMSKLCSSEEEAKQTVLSYQKKFEASESPYDSPYYYKLPNQEKWVVKNKSTGKALKSINYTPVNFK